MKLSKLLPEAGCTCKIECDGEFEFLEQCTRIRASKSLTYLEKGKFANYLTNPDISCVICKPEDLDIIPKNVIHGIATTNEPKLAFFKLHNYLISLKEKKETVISKTAKISPQAYVAPYDVVIGDNVEIQPFVAIYEGTVIEENVRICSGTVIAGQSFTSVHDGPENMFLVKDAGGVLIKKGVEICSGCHIACGTLQKDITTIGEYTKLDAKVHVGHGTVLGKRVLVPSGAHIAGNCIVGDDVWIGVNATVSNRIEIGDHARVSLGSVVTQNVPEGQTVSGNFAIPHEKFIENLKKLRG